MTWRDDKALTVAQLSNNMSASLVPDTAYWQAYAYQQIKNLLTGMDKRCPVDSDFTDIATAIADSDVNTYGALRITKTHSVDAVTLSIPGGGFSLVGDGFGNAKIDSAKTSGTSGTGIPMIKVDNKDIVYISGIEIDGNAANNTFMGEHDHGIHVQDSDYVVISNCYIHDVSGDGIYIKNCDYVIIENCIIQVPNVNASGPQVGRNCVAVVEGSYIAINNNIMTGGLPAAIDIEPNAAKTASHISIVGNNISGAYDMGISVADSAASSAAEDIDIIGNHIDQSVNEGIRLIAGDRISIKSNTCVGNGTGSSSDGKGIDVTSDNTTIEGNYCYNNYDSGINVGSAKTNLQIINNRLYSNGSKGLALGGTSGSEIDFVSVIGNFCYNNSQNTGDTADGIFADYTDHSQFVGNYCYDNQGTQTQRNGILIQNSDNVMVCNNFCHNNATAELSVNSGNVTNVVMSYNWDGTTVANSPMTGHRAALGADFTLRLNSGKFFSLANAGGTEQFAVKDDGKIETNQSAANTATPSGATAYDLAIYNAAGSLLGYIPVYAAQWT